MKQYNHVLERSECPKDFNFDDWIREEIWQIYTTLKLMDSNASPY